LHKTQNHPKTTQSDNLMEHVIYSGYYTLKMLNVKKFDVEI